jgi:hypothetical protein
VKSFPDTVKELWALLKAYAIQELYQPLKALPWYVGIGLGGAAATAVGVGLLLLGLLRMVQFEGHRTFDASGDSSALPYLVIAIVSIVLIVLLASRINRQFEENP